MHNPLHKFLAVATQKAHDDILAAYLELPIDKRYWSPGGMARSAADMMAECAIMNDSTGLLASRALPPDFDYAEFQKAKTKLGSDHDNLLTQLRDSTVRGILALQSVPESDFDDVIPMPWGNFTVQEVMAYPFWNMSYHLGQINAIAAQLEAPE